MHSDSLLVTFLGMASYTAYLYLPGHIVMIIRVCQYILGLSNATDATIATKGATPDIDARSDMWLYQVWDPPNSPDEVGIVDPMK